MGEIQLSVQELFAMPENSYQLVDTGMSVHVLMV